jgi:hypothetical protein
VPDYNQRTSEDLGGGQGALAAGWRNNGHR